MPCAGLHALLTGSSLHERDVQISDVGSRRTPVDQVAEGTEEVIRAVGDERRVGADAMTRRALCTGPIDDGAGCISRPVDAVRSRAREYHQSSARCVVDHWQRAQRKFLVATAASTAPHVYGRFARSDDAQARADIQLQRLCRKSGAGLARLAARGRWENMNRVAKLRSGSRSPFDGHLPVANDLVMAVPKSRIARLRRFVRSSLEMLERAARNGISPPPPFPHPGRAR